MADILLNTQPVNFPALDLSYLQPQAWEKYYIEEHVKKAMHTTPEALDRARVRDKSNTNGVDLPLRQCLTMSIISSTKIILDLRN